MGPNVGPNVRTCGECNASDSDRRSIDWICICLEDNDRNDLAGNIIRMCYKSVTHLLF